MSTRNPTSSYRAYVVAMKAKINEADLREARASINRQRRRKTAIATSKTMATIGSVAAGVLGIVVLAKATKPTKPRSGR